MLLGVVQSELRTRNFTVIQEVYFSVEGTHLVPGEIKLLPGGDFVSMWNLQHGGRVL